LALSQGAQVVVYAVRSARVYGVDVSVRSVDITMQQGVERGSFMFFDVNSWVKVRKQ
jgi:hypothetical protein